MWQISQQDIDKIALWHLLHYSVSAFNKLMKYFPDASSAIQQTAIPIWQNLKLHKNYIERLQQFYQSSIQQDFQKRLIKLQQNCDHILFKGQQNYPEALLNYDNSPPLLFVRGNHQILSEPQIAMVGSRNPSPHGAQIAYDFAHFFSENNFVVTSGLASGIDAASHQGAIQKGKTVAIIGTGLDQCYPSTHQKLWQDILQHDGAIVSEFLPDTPPIKANFPRRNRIISSLSLGTVVVEAGVKSGSLITAQYAVEQGKQVFAIPGHIYSPHHQGCHQLIREGATLVDHPIQVIEDLTMFTTVIAKTSEHAVLPTEENLDGFSAISIPEQSTIPEHLNVVYQCLDWATGISVDELTIRLDKSISELDVALVELELLGLCQQHAGRYLRCSSSI